MFIQRMTALLLPMIGAAVSASAIMLSAPAAAIPEGCTNLSGGSGTPNNGSQPGGTGTGAGAGNSTGGVSGGSDEDPDACCGGGAASDEVHSGDCHSGNVGGFAGDGVPLHEH